MTEGYEGELRLRRAGRVLLLDDAQNLLLFRGSEIGGTRDLVWYTPGGGLEDGETYEEAALRELWEETGLTGITLGPCVWQRRRVRRESSGWVDSRSRFFLVTTSRFELDLMAIPAAGEIPEYRWWSIEEIDAAGPEWFIPKRLAVLLRPILAGNIPSVPLDASD